MSEPSRSHPPGAHPPAASRRATPGSQTLTGTVQVPFPEFITPPPEPMGLLSQWLEAAGRHGVREPGAMALATADARGRTSSRTVALTQVSDSGIVFITHADSRKGRELAENPWASGVLYWRETSRQITFAGPVTRLPDAQAQALWSARALFTHAMTTLSRQSTPLEDLDHVARLRARARELGQVQRPLPRPYTFAGYRLEPATVEFWDNGTDRLHERLVYQVAEEGWRISRLQP
ncbi:phenazine biosynthesis FMN-dependent oxidase PhzG [Streptomyces sp. IB201691-2A2]|uniref:phenazine biosynthesis FMN-dependent oxidase PhzG n=1 Tax=Streptomyces sp. IB201691-2A2 TaxID=2561920 RepID=UPI00117FEEC7|nr:phenazine biosynthesis FMN-dependent oxidase PhzG [Streptomyces sp. IB201691-2A2]TRO56448.1 pyridoxamine 5'-phosphate oxidase [Streptomyces sp. IB201691-2A2]